VVEDQLILGVAVGQHECRQLPALHGAFVLCLGPDSRRSCCA
jgi:hypothetical protein